MKLKKLELIGFKSFAEKTTFEFDSALTALVGPNGSGKSNIVDAIKWVLGEQSARSLRGGEMTDVIFNGSESRKALGRAEARITFENDRGLLPLDYDQVCISRQIDRSGQSEYFLNGKPCRLKDIRQLLLDTGVGVSCYSLIEQGQVDILLQANSQQRRAVLEEAAGINRFLDQKKEAERKLDRVRINLERVSDIIEEVERQLRGVKYQAGKARRFKRCSEELEQLRVAQALHRRSQLIAERDQQAEYLERLEEGRHALDEQTGSAKGDLAASSKEVEAFSQELETQQQRMAQIEAQRASLAREVEMNRRRTQEMDSRCEALSQRAQVLQERIESLRAERGDAGTSLKLCAETLQGKGDLCKTKQETVSKLASACSEQEVQIEEQKKHLFDLFQEQSQLQNQIAVLSSEKQTLLNRQRRQAEHRDQIGASARGTEKQLRETQEDLHRTDCELTQLGDSMETVDGKLAAEAEDLESINSQVAGAKAELSAKCSRKELLEDLQARAEGVSSGVKLLLGDGRSNEQETAAQRAEGMVADLIDVDMEYAAAVDAALGERVQAVVFERADRAGAALKMLTDRKKGRAEVVVMDRLSPRPQPPRPEVNGLRQLGDFVRCEQRFLPLVDFLLGGTFLVADRQEALGLLEKRLPQGTRLVTRDGECFSSSGLWAAGRPDEGSLLSRKSELAALGSQIAGLHQTVQDLTVAKDQCRGRIEDLQRRRRQLDSRKEELTQSSNQVRAQLQILQNTRRELQKELELTEQEEEVLAREIQQADRHLESADGELGRLEEKKTATEAAAAALRRALGEKAELKGDLLRQIGALSDELARMEEKQKGLQALLARLEDDVRLRCSELAGAEAELEANRRQFAEAEEAIASALSQRDALETERQELESKIEQTRKCWQASKKQIEQLNALFEEMSARKEELEQKRQDVRIKQNEAQITLGNLTERILDDYDVNLEALELQPEQWRDRPLFSNRTIVEFAEVPQHADPEPVAQWYAESEQQGGGEPDRDERTAPAAISLEEAAAYRDKVLSVVNDPSTDWTALKQRADDLRKRMDAIGSVDIEAIRRQDELEMRQQFLSNQRDDLAIAYRHEKEIIAELNRKSRERFVETFEAVRGNLQLLFRKLFGGGKADLILEEGAEDVLDAGIEITARPPGKQTRSISLLSGGEKALTTVAFLFSIFKTKPSPFCILDEADATLDEANIGRFVSMLQEFTDHTQFLIVTHSKVTMSAAEVLYGVSMAESGTSTKLSVRFEQVGRELGRASQEAGSVRRRVRAG